MKVTPIHETHSVYNSQEDIRASIEAENLVSVLGTLTNLYSDPIYAIVREYSTNARDSHVAAGTPDLPIEVSLPTEGHREFVVRDYGVGLDLDELRRTYLSYGASTKRDSDDFNGTLGLGSKSGLTYAPLGFQVTAVKDGRKILAVIAQDQDGVGVMRILDDSPTSEHNGVTIKVPVEAGDEHLFHAAARRLFSVWEPGTVIVHGAKDEDSGQEFEVGDIFTDDSLIWLDEDVALSQGHSSMVIMGNVPYRFNRVSAWGYHVIARVPMGAVHFTPSREDLHYTDLTNETLDLLMEYVDQRAEAMVIKRVIDAPTPWAKMEAWTSIRHSLSSSLRRRFDHLTVPYLPRNPVKVDGWGYRWRPGHRNGVSTFEVLYHSMVVEEHDIVITGWPYQPRTLSATQRERLRCFGVHPSVDRRYNSRFVLLPGNAPEQIEGRPNVYTWDQVVAATPVEKKPRGQRVQVVYTVWKDGTELGPRTDIDPADGPIVWLPYSRWSTRDFTQKYREVQAVMLKANQVAKFERLHPTAVASHLYAQTANKAALDALTDADRLRWHSEEWRWLADSVNDLADPELIEVLRSITVGASETFKHARHLGVQAPARPAILSTLTERYPLIDALYYGGKQPKYRDDIVLYLNARWAQEEAERKVAEQAEALANGESIEEGVDDAV